MEFRMPSYYNEFKCIADKCPDTCCSGWAIVIDKNTLDKYKNIPGDDGEYIRGKIDFEEGIYKQNGERCAFLNDCNLCDLIINQGEQKLCKTCTRYPRHFEEYGDLVEAALSMSCPVAAKLIIDRASVDKFKFRIDDSKRKVEQLDKKFLNLLLGIRFQMFGITSDRTKTLDQRMKDILLFAEKLQLVIFEYEKLGAKRKLSVFSKKIFERLEELRNVFDSESADVRNHTENNKLEYERIKEYIDMFLGLENINADWPRDMGEVISTLYLRRTPQEYAEIKSEFYSYMKPREYEYEHILNYFLYTYFLGSVYDYNILGMVKLAVVSTIIIREMSMAKWLKNDKKLSVEHQVQSAYAYSRQVEHSEDNQLAFEGILTAHPKFSSEEIISVLNV